MLKANIETFLACDASYEEAGIVLYGAPFDSTTSYRPGTRFGSRAIRSESYGLESYSPYQDRDLTDYAVFDAGDQYLCFGDASLALKDLRERAAEVAGDGKIPFMLGGEHLVTLAPVQALAEKYPELKEQLGVVVFGNQSQQIQNMLPFKVYPLAFVSNEHQLVDIYNSVDLFVPPSLEENLPNMIM